MRLVHYLSETLTRNMPCVRDYLFLARNPCVCDVSRMHELLHVRFGHHGLNRKGLRELILTDRSLFVRLLTSLANFRRLFGKAVKFRPNLDKTVCDPFVD